MTVRPARIALGLAMSAAVALASIGGSGGAVLAAKADKKASKKAAVEEPQVSGPVQLVKGKKLKVALAKVANNWTRFNDPQGDQVDRAGDPVIDAEPWTDLVEVNVVAGPAAPKMLRVMGEDYPEGTARSYYGADADWNKGETAYYVIARTDERLPRDMEGSVQLIVTFDGEDAASSQVADPLRHYAGAEQFSISGLFDGGPWSSGTTDLAEWQRGDAIPFYNGPSQDIGYYDQKGKAFVHIARRPKGATSATVTLRVDREDGEIFDTVTLPAGGRFIGTKDALWGLNVAKSATPLVCRALETISAGSAGADDLEAGSSLIRYTVGWDAQSDVGDQVAALDGSVEVALTGPDAPDEPLIVDATVSLVPSGQAATFSMAVPDGQWLASPLSADALIASNGQSLLDLRPLTGSAGVLTGPGLDGLVAGIAECGELVTEPVAEPLTEPLAE